MTTTQQHTQTPASIATLHRLKVGMTVYDVHQEVLGEIMAVFNAGFNAVSPTGKVQSDFSQRPQQTVTSSIAGMFVGGQHIPELLYVRLNRQCFAQVTPVVPTAKTFYIFPQDIEGITSSSIMLTISRGNVLSS